MPLYYDKAKARWRWQFNAQVAGERHRLSRLLPTGWSESQAKRFDDQETARTYARLSKGRKVLAPAIDAAVFLYVTERVPKLADGVNSAANLSHLQKVYEGKTLDQLGAVAREYARDQADILKPATIRQRLATLRAAASYAFKQHSLGTLDWIAAMPMPSVDNARHVYLDRSQVLTLARACKHPAARALILLTFATGSRPGELHKAIKGVDHFGKRLKNGEYQLLPVPKRYQRYMHHWPMQYDYSTLSRHFRAAREATGMEHVKPHDLRHSTASALLKRGATLPQIGKVLNHKTAQATNRYLHLDTEMKAALVESIFERVGQKRSHLPPEKPFSPMKKKNARGL